jgi:hypothetical protein
MILECAGKEIGERTMTRGKGDILDWQNDLRGLSTIILEL